MEIPYTKQTLANGLDVIVHEDRHLPMVAINLWYHVGSKNERPDRTGFAHLFEHLMFEGSAHHDRGYFEPLQRAGGLVNGSTSGDRTNYWEVVPSGALELALWMESDRMGYLLPALTAEKFQNQRDVVLNERRQNYENRPYGLAGLALATALYPPDHPYHWPTIGWPDDLRAATLDEAKDFFRAYYHPANASLCIAGDVEEARAFDLAHRYFVEIARGSERTRPAGSARLDAEKRLVMEDRVELPRLYLNWHSPAMYGDGDAELDLVADVLAHGKTSRLYRTLVFERRMAADVSAYQHSREMDGVFQIAVTGVPGVALEDIHTVVIDAVRELSSSGPDESELARGQAQTEAQFVYRLQTIGGFGGKSDQLNAYNVFRGDPGFFAGDRARYEAASSDRIARAVRTWLVDRPYVSLCVVPQGRGELALAGAAGVSVP
ncbi:MAG: insulinase family protein [Acidobacteria bacterium]|nr:insulinase family protein [Acidobacteriota bacterium]